MQMVLFFANKVIRKSSQCQMDFNCSYPLAHRNPCCCCLFHCPTLAATATTVTTFIAS